MAEALAIMISIGLSNCLITVFSIIVGVLLLYHCLLYPSRVSPLAKVPSAHWSSPFVPWWILWKRYKQQELLAATEAHQRLGPIIRLGPEDLSVSSYEDGIRLIYGGGFEKPAYFDFFSHYGFECNGLVPQLSC